MKTSSRDLAAFTILEIMLAVAILGLMCGTIYQFTGTMVRASEVATRIDDREQRLAGLRRLLGNELSGLPQREAGTLVGVNVKGKYGRRDAMQLICTAGNALLTPDAHGFYQITLDLREIPRDSGKYVLGIEREPWSPDDDDDDDDDDTPAGGASAKTLLNPTQKLPSDWVRLMDGVRTLEVTYFDNRLNAWVDRWTDQAMRPPLVRVRLTTDDGGAPYEVIEPIPGGGVRQAPPTLITPAVTATSTNGQTVTNAARTPGR